MRYWLNALLIAALSCSGNAWAQAGLDDIVLPEGFSIEIYTDEVPGARALALGDDGTVFVGTRKGDAIYALVPRDNGGVRLVTVAGDLKTPNSVAFHNGDLFVAETTRIIRYDDIEKNLDNIPQPQVVNDSFPDESHHGKRYIAFGPDDKLYISIGAPCNICDRGGFGNISRLNADGTGLEVFAEGIRNSVGFTWHPQTGDLWFTDNGRDMLGDDTPPGELNRAAQSGMHFGYPYCHGGEVKDPEFGDQRSCDEFVAPVQKLGAHVAPLGVKFYSGDMFPPEYRGQIFIAEHGSWNRSKKTGYRISLVRLSGNTARSYETFAEGWLQGEEVSGRPVDILILDDGSMLVSDDKAGRVYRIRYTKPLTGGIASAGN